MVVCCEVDSAVVLDMAHLEKFQWMLHDSVSFPAELEGFFTSMVHKYHIRAIHYNATVGWIWQPSIKFESDSDVVCKLTFSPMRAIKMKPNQCPMLRHYLVSDLACLVYQIDATIITDMRGLIQLGLKRRRSAERNSFWVKSGIVMDDHGVWKCRCLCLKRFKVYFPKFDRVHKTPAGN